jgi:hypothetical protein
MFQRQKTFERHRNECDCADDTISGSSLAESSVHAAAATQYTSQMEFSQSTSLDNDSRGKYECKRCQKLHDSQRDLKQHMAKSMLLHSLL